MPQLKAISSGPHTEGTAEESSAHLTTASFQRVVESSAHLITASFQGVVEKDEVPPQSPPVKITQAPSAAAHET